MWKDKVKLWRYERQLKCVEKAERMAQDAGFTPQAVPPKILFPLLDGVSLEEDETLHDMWALLANAASPDGQAKIRPGSIAILKQMSAEEASLLIWIFHNTLVEEPHDDEGHMAYTIPAVSDDGKLYGAAHVETFPTPAPSPRTPRVPDQRNSNWWAELMGRPLPWAR